MSILASASALLRSTLSKSIVGHNRAYVHQSTNHFGRPKKRFPKSVTPFASTFHIPSASAVRSLYRALLRASARFPDDLVRLYVAARCRSDWRDHRAAHREAYQNELQAAYEQQKARLQVRERLRRIQVGQSDEAATRAALAMRFDALSEPPPHLLHMTAETPLISISLRRTMHDRFSDAQRQLQLLHNALSHADAGTLIDSRTELLCAAYGWQGGRVLDRLFHLRAMYFDAPHMLRPASLLALHPLHRYLVTGVRAEDERPVVAAAGGRRPAVGVYEWWPVGKSDRAHGEALVSGVRWMECYRLLILQRCQVLDAQWRRACSNMLRQRQIIGQPGEVEQAGSAVHKGKLNADERKKKVEQEKRKKSSKRKGAASDQTN